MEKIKKGFVMFGLGLFNIIHSASHLIQFLQSVLLMKSSTESCHEEHGLLDEFLHNPYLVIFWFVLGITTLVIGVREFFHHKKCS